MNYKFGNKNNWRRWVWNRIIERLTVPTKDAVVLYLAGEDNIDREIALSHGFKPDNLIAIEKDKTIVNHLRRNGQLCVQGDIIDILRAWPHNKLISVIIADFCCGLEKRIMEYFTTAFLQSPHTRTSIFAINLLRGRDPSTNQLRESWTRNRLDNMMWETSTINRKHRGVMVTTEYATVLLSVVFGKIVFISEGKLQYNKETTMQGEWIEYYNKHHKGLWKVMQPAFNSYKSVSGQIFDSAIWSSGISCNEFFDDDGVYDNRINAVHVGTSERRRIAAILAHRTMRLNS